MAIKDLIPWRRRRESLYPALEDSPFVGLQRQMNEVMDQFMSGWGFDKPVWGGDFNPRVDVSEDNEHVYVNAELPGVSEKEIGVTLSDKVLIIKGEKTEEHKRENGKSRYQVERRYGSFERQLALPAEVKDENVDATFKHGVLNIVLEKKEPSKFSVRKIQIRQQS